MYDILLSLFCVFELPAPSTTVVSSIALLLLCSFCEIELLILERFDLCSDNDNSS